MVNLSKSKYCALWQCPKMLWLRKYKPELAEVDSHTLSIMETGNAVGDLAMGLFGDFTEVTVYTDGGDRPAGYDAPHAGRNCKGHPRDLRGVL